MKFVMILFLLIHPITNSCAQYKTLITTKSDDNYSELEIKTLYQINYTRVLNKLRPLYTNKTLNNYSKFLASKLQTKNIDTSVNNTIIIYFNDSIPLTNTLLKDTFDLIGIHTLSHQYKCQIMVITLDKRREQIKWKDLDCPKFMKSN